MGSTLTGRQRLTATIEGRKTDRLCWTTLVDHNTLGLLPADKRGMSCVDFYRYVGCDILQLGGWCIGPDITGSRLVRPGVETETSVEPDGTTITREHSRHGTLTSVSKVHPVEYLVKDGESLRTYLATWEDAYYEAEDHAANYANLMNAVGDDGIVTVFAWPTALPFLLEIAVGMENFYYLLQDCPDEMGALIECIHRADLERWRLMAEGPWDVCILAENTSTRYISPAIYERYNLPSQRAFVEAMHARGKTAILHMCGHVRDLLPMIRETGADGIHTLTPPPLGDTPWELALDVLGEDTIIFGCLTPDVFQTMPVAEMGPALDRLISPRLRESRFVLAPMADGIPTPVERFLGIRDWVLSRAS